MISACRPRGNSKESWGSVCACASDASSMWAGFEAGASARWWRRYTSTAKTHSKARKIATPVTGLLKTGSMKSSACASCVDDVVSTVVAVIVAGAGVSATVSVTVGPGRPEGAEAAVEAVPAEGVAPGAGAVVTGSLAGSVTRPEATLPELCKGACAFPCELAGAGAMAPCANTMGAAQLKARAVLQAQKICEIRFNACILQPKSLPGDGTLKRPTKCAACGAAVRLRPTATGHQW